MTRAGRGGTPAQRIVTHPSSRKKEKRMSDVTKECCLEGDAWHWPGDPFCHVAPECPIGHDLTRHPNPDADFRPGSGGRPLCPLCQMLVNADRGSTARPLFSAYTVPAADCGRTHWLAARGEIPVAEPLADHPDGQHCHLFTRVQAADVLTAGKFGHVPM